MAYRGDEAAYGGGGGGSAERGLPFEMENFDDELKRVLLVAGHVTIELFDTNVVTDKVLFYMLMIDGNSVGNYHLLRISKSELNKLRTFEIGKKNRYDDLDQWYKRWDKRGRIFKYKLDDFSLDTVVSDAFQKAEGMLHPLFGLPNIERKYGVRHLFAIVLFHINDLRKKNQYDWGLDCLLFIDIFKNYIKDYHFNEAEIFIKVINQQVSEERENKPVDSNESQIKTGGAKPNDEPGSPPEETPETSYEKAERLIQEAIQNKSTHLNLSGLGLTKLPSGFAKMQTLKTLSLDNNLLIDLSKEIGKLQNLNTLSLNNNRLKSWPVSIFQLAKLTELDLRNNKLKNIDDSLFKLKRLQRLYVNNNPLEPLSIDSKKKLREVEYVDIDIQIPAEGSPEQAVKPVYDSPTFTDKLGRESFAKKIADMLNFIWMERKFPFGDVTTPIMLHLHGPWGSGKSSLINFIRNKLEYPIPEIVEGKIKIINSWKVIEFNAWRNQHVDPPWWALYSEIRREGFGRREKISIAVSSYFTRLFKTKAPYIFGITIFSGLLLLYKKKFGLSFEIKLLETIVEVANGAVTLIGSIFSFFIAFGRAISLSSSENASQFMIEKDSPMSAIRKSFKNLMTRSKKPILVVIDDMDRCHTAYTVKLLEGVQTLFAHRNIAYLVAADRRWLYSCYETTYREFAGNIQEPGKPLGAHFLEKAFDFSFPVPGISEEAKEAYWKELIGVEEGETGEEATKEAGLDTQAEAQEESKPLPREGALRRKKEEYKQQYRKNFAGKSVEEKYNALKDLKKNFTEQQAMREVIVEESGKKEALECTEHFLRQFWQLVEPNPRAMKRLLNAYSIQMDLATLMGLEMAELGVRKQLVLFTIVSMRWPLLEREIIRKPQVARKILNPSEEFELDDYIQEIIDQDSDIKKVFQGGDTGVELDEKALQGFRKIQPEINVDGSVA